MVGDVNIFIYKSSDEDVSETCGHQQDTLPWIVEIEIMVAEPTAKRQSIGKVAVIWMMNYVSTHASEIFNESHAKYVFKAKIGRENYPSISMFESLGYQQTKVIEVFQEIHFTYPLERCNPSIAVPYKEISII
jgi:hypothetical protein